MLVPGVSASGRGVAELGGVGGVVLGAAGQLWLWPGERERGVVGGVEEVELRQAVGEAHDDAAGAAHDPARYAEEQVSQRLGVAAQRRVLGRGAAGGRGRADVAP